MLLALGLGLTIGGGLFKAWANKNQADREAAEMRTRADDAEEILRRQRETARKNVTMQARQATEDLTKQNVQAQSGYTANLGARGIKQTSATAGAVRGEMQERTNTAIERVDESKALQLESINTKFDAGMDDIEAMRRGAQNVEIDSNWQIGADLFDTAASSLNYGTSTGLW